MLRKLGLLLAVLTISLLVNLGTFPVHHEEPRRGIIAFEMMKARNFIQPTVLAKPYFKKPPLHNYILVIFYKLFGVNEFSLRLPSVIAVILISMLLFLFSKPFIGSEIALDASMIFPTSWMVLFGYSTKCEPDMIFTLFVFLSISIFMYFFYRNKELYAWIFGYFFTSAAFLTKGLPAIAFFWISILVYLLFYRKVSELISIKHILGLLIGLSPIIIYILLIPDKHSAFQSLLSEATERTALDYSISTFTSRFLSFPVRLVLSLFPWSFILLFLLAKRKISLKLPNDNFVRLNLLMVLANLIIYLVSPGTRMRYVLPIFPFASIVFAYYLKDFKIDAKRAFSIVQFLSDILLFSGIGFGLWFTRSGSLTLRVTIYFLLVTYLIYFYVMYKVRISRLTLFVALLFVIFRAYYSSYYISIGTYLYPSYRRAAMEISKLTKGKELYTKTNYLQLCFYIEKFRDKILPYRESLVKGKIFLSSKVEGRVLKSFKLGKHRFYLLRAG